MGRQRVSADCCPQDLEGARGGEHLLGKREFEVQTYAKITEPHSHPQPIYICEMVTIESAGLWFRHHAQHQAAPRAVCEAL